MRYPNNGRRAQRGHLGGDRARLQRAEGLLRAQGHLRRRDEAFAGEEEPKHRDGGV